jgi:RNA polymerase sigma-70 factor (ECF subfamily)
MEIYERHINTIYRICFTYMKNKADTEDAVQNTFIKLLKYKGRFENEEHEKAWLIVTASNLCKDYLRHWWQKREPIEDYEDLCGQSPYETDDILVTVLSLPVKYKTVIFLYYYEGYTSAEIAKILHKPKSTIRNYLHEGREILRKKLGGEFDEK